MGRHRLSQRRGATETELRQSWWDIVTGMAFSNVIMYFIILATASTLFPAGQTDINTAAGGAASAVLIWFFGGDRHTFTFSSTIPVPPRTTPLNARLPPLRDVLPRRAGASRPSAAPG